MPWTLQSSKSGYIHRQLKVFHQLKKNNRSLKIILILCIAQWCYNNSEAGVLYWQELFALSCGFVTEMQIKILFDLTHELVVSFCVKNSSSNS